MDRITGLYFNSASMNKTWAAGIRKSSTIPFKNDVFFRGFNKAFNLSKASSVKDIPKDANIFLFNCHNKLSIPPSQEIKECILTDKGFGFWKQLSGEDANKMLLKNNTVDYAHGDLAAKNRTCGVIEADNSKVKQIEGVTMVRLKNNSDVEFIDQVNEMDAFDSTIGTANVKNAIHLNGNCKAGTLNAFKVLTYPGDEVGKMHVNWVGCKGDINKPGQYSVIDEILADEAAEITQTKINNVKTKDIVIDNSVAKNVDAIYGVMFNNSSVEHLQLASIQNLTDSKIKKFDLINASEGVKFNNKVQIDELNIFDDEARLYFFPKPEWGKKTNNYIKKINIKTQEGCIYRDPRIKIQGDIDINEIEFHGGPGMLYMTREEDPKKPIRVINGYIKYGCKKEKPPEDYEY